MSSPSLPQAPYGRSHNFIATGIGTASVHTLNHMYPPKANLIMYGRAVASRYQISLLRLSYRCLTWSVMSNLPVKVQSHWRRRDPSPRAVHPEPFSPVTLKRLSYPTHNKQHHIQPSAAPERKIALQITHTRSPVAPPIPDGASRRLSGQCISELEYAALRRATRFEHLHLTSA